MKEERDKQRAINLQPAVAWTPKRNMCITGETKY